MVAEVGLLDRLARRVEDYRFTLRLGEKGRVASVGDGIAWVYGLPSAAAEEILHFEDGSRGMVFELQKERLGVILLDPEANVASGSLVSHTGERLEIGVGDGLLGRVVDPLGKPLDAMPPYDADGFSPLEGASPPIVARDFVNRPLYTGAKVVDTLIPIGRGQRQLIIGDSGTGKTSLALDTVVAQAGQGVKCVYVMIGQKRSEAALVIDLLRRHGALAYTTVVVGEATATPGMKYLAPFAGCAIAEGWMRRGEDTLVIYDDLTTHARAYRELSLLMHRPPGREAYPGDIFYLHARLLERSTRLSPDHGGGSLTALPLVETEEGEIAAYIPTNLISITDGQIYLDRRLFAAGILPAVDVPLSVSRIGGKAQHPRIREEASRMKLDYLQFLELEVFTRFGTKLEAGTEVKIRRGRLLREILKQERLNPLPATFHLAWMIAFNTGLLDAFEPNTLPDALQKILAGLEHVPLPLDTGRDEWLVRLKNWLDDVP
ncbi:ATP synthase F0F1 subunit alpha (plasmid) [Sulfuricella denitrificans skB26]|uniref:ATP synthase subunit alpha n=1 Tax=Sulfuricella denitrificans (strain DSM 22764 / NBRC 105220 / skB26) TaxID=1163617 RepID=S6AKD6_SULDS|nr:F0F1 ATP synthase subunit alpha [Sulfuricella denitrificans]BAN36866.1 ATP synthase F0F1 subunit alpha [Sulfuricella denitrificans skB26]